MSHQLRSILLVKDMGCFVRGQNRVPMQKPMSILNATLSSLMLMVALMLIMPSTLLAERPGTSDCTSCQGFVKSVFVDLLHLRRGVS